MHKSNRSLRVEDTPAAYPLAHGPHHRLLAGDVQGAVDTLTDYASANDRLARFGAEGWVDDLEVAHGAAQRGAEVREPESLRLWEAFARERSHILARGNARWPQHKILLQLAVEHADDSPVTRAAEAWLEAGSCDWVWLRNPRRAAHAAPAPCLRVFEGHTACVNGAQVLADGRILSWSRREFCAWDLETLELLERVDAREVPFTHGHWLSVHATARTAAGDFVAWALDRTCGLASTHRESHECACWQDDAKVQVKSSLADGTLFATTEDGHLYALKLYRGGVRALLGGI